MTKAPAGRRTVTRPRDTKATTAAAARAVEAARTAEAGDERVGDTSFAYTSATGDYIGQGRSRTFRPSETMTVAITGNQSRLAVNVHDADYTTWWSAQLSAGVGDVLRPGTFTNAERDSFKTGRSPGLDVSGEGRGCNTVHGAFTVNQIAFDDSGNLELADVTFTQRCESASAPAFTGTIHLDQFPLSYGMVSDSGDYVGGGATKTYLNSTSLISLSGNASGFGFSVSGLRDWWSGSINAPTGQQLEVGRTYEASRFGDDTHARLDVGGNGRGCNESNGTVTIHDLELTDGRITHLSATFVQHCEGDPEALRGTLHYFA